MMVGHKLLKDEATEEKGERARMASFVGAMAIADLVKTTLGPKGMDKILQSTGRGHSVTVTNDGATILKSIHIDNPAAKVLVGILCIVQLLKSSAMINKSQWTLKLLFASLVTVWTLDSGDPLGMFYN
ncbi:hypothetical protein DM860_006727 [Cuscuta australis]|uniref:T-complex protein 1 subunit beta n=1 Tax=Cuscuta australis TaxID=267555 RepID=A0A328D4D4_9ASTE|nr:hypothetical protein DM860_006727 [Cuscuta australis]